MIRDFRSLWAFMKMLKIEVYFFLVFFCLNLQIVTNTQLMEDKLCFNELEYPKEFCLSTDSEELFNDHRKYILLEKTTSMNNYRTIIEVVPSMFLALFGGYWVDTYPSHIKFILTLPVIAEMTKMVILIINCYFFDLSKSISDPLVSLIPGTRHSNNNGAIHPSFALNYSPIYSPLLTHKSLLQRCISRSLGLSSLRLPRNRICLHHRSEHLHRLDHTASSSIRQVRSGRAVSDSR